MAGALRQSAETAAVVAEVLRVFESLSKRNILYGDIFSPLHDDGLREVARRLTIRVDCASLGEQDVEVVMPPVFGRYVMVISTDVNDRRRSFALRHGIGHVAADHVTDVAFLRNHDERNAYMAHEERVADLFALADVVPWYMLGEHRKARTGWGAIRQVLCRVIREHTVDWPEERVLDRAELRLALYRSEMA